MQDLCLAYLKGDLGSHLVSLCALLSHDENTKRKYFVGDRLSAADVAGLSNNRRTSRLLLKPAIDHLLLQVFAVLATVQIEIPQTLDYFPVLKVFWEEMAKLSFVRRCPAMHNVEKCEEQSTGDFNQNTQDEEEKCSNR